VAFEQLRAETEAAGDSMSRELTETMVVCVPVTVEGLVDPRWGRADRVAVATGDEAGIEDWQEFDVGWGSLHDSGSEGSHHARVARFLREHEVEAVVAHHMGDGMRHMLEKMGLTVRLGEAGSAKESATRVLGVEPDAGPESPPR
jgi:predicted Fe-Mo cluster-binding NifX family protein